MGLDSNKANFDSEEGRFSKITLTFKSKVTEALFQQQYADDMLWHTRVAAGSASAIYFFYAFFISDIVQPEHSSLVWILVSIAIVASVIYIAASYFNFFKRYFIYITACYSFFFGIGCFSPIFFAENNPGYYYVYACLTILAIFILIGTRFIHALLITLCIITMALFVAINLRDIPASTIITANFILISASIFSAIAGYMLESARRQTFVDRQSLHRVILNLELREKQLKEMTIRDPLTNLYNRRFFNEVFQLNCKEAIRQQSSLTLFIIDIDFFKQYNDHYGHPAGDQALQKVGTSLQYTFRRDSDKVFRIGGEEFAAIVLGNDKVSIIEITKRLLQNIRELGIQHQISDVSEYLTVSIGIAYMTAGNTISHEQLYAHSDSALYQVKSEGRNNYKILEF